MSEFGVWESIEGSDSEKKIATAATQNKLNAAIYDVREQYGNFLFGSRDIAEFRDRVALCKDDAMKTIDNHLYPVTGVVRRIIGKGGALEKEFKQRQADAPGLPASPTGNEPPSMSGAPGMPANAGSFSNVPAAGAEYGLPSSAGNTAARRVAGPQQQQQVQQPQQPSPADYANVTAEKAKMWLQGQPETGSAVVASRYAGEHSLNEMGGTVTNPYTGDDGGSFHGNPEGHGHWDKPASRRADKTGPAMDLDETFAPKKDKDLVPKDAWDSYRNSVDQGAPEKVSDCFGTTELQKDSRRHLAIQQYSDWCECNGLKKASVANLDKYAENLGDATYFRIADVVLQASDDGPSMIHLDPGGGMPTGHPIAQSCPQCNPSGAAAGLQAMGSVQRRRTADGPTPGPSTSGPAAPGGAPAGGASTEGYASTVPTVPTATTAPGDIGIGQSGNWAGASRQRPQPHYRTAAPDYLQKADEALTNLLNQKAEEFQEGIGALQQALQTVQYAESVQQQQNPLNVQPPAGTVNVLPQTQDPGAPPAGGAGVLDQGAPADPAAGGGAPDPAAGGAGLAGMPAPGGDPAAGGPPPDPSQMVARRRKQACYPGCEENEAHAKKFHKDKGEKESRRRQADYPHDSFEESGRQDYPPPQHPAVAEYHNWAQQNGVDPEDALEHYDQHVRPLSNDEYTAVVDSVSGGHGGWEPGAGPHRQSSGRAGKQNHPFDRRRSGSVFDDWQKWQGSGNTIRGGDSDYDAFGSQFGYGQQAIDKLKNQHGTNQSTQGMAHAAPPPAPAPAAPGKIAVQFDEHGFRAQPPHTHKPGMTYHVETEDGFEPIGPFEAQHAVGQGQHVRVHGVDPKRPEIGKSLPAGTHFDIPERQMAMASRKQAWQGWGGEIEVPGHHKAAGWDWDDHLNGYLSMTADRFICKCGQSVPVPSYSQCHCGKLWNIYSVGTSGGDQREAALEKFVAREIPVRPDVIVASKRGDMAADTGTRRVRGVESRKGAESGSRSATSSFGSSRSARSNIESNSQWENGEESRVSRRSSRDDSYADGPSVSRSTERSRGSSSQQRVSRQSSGEPGIRNEFGQYAGYGPGGETVATEQNSLSRRASAGRSESGSQSAPSRVAAVPGLFEGEGYDQSSSRIDFSNRSGSTLYADNAVVLDRPDTQGAIHEFHRRVMDGEHPTDVYQDMMSSVPDDEHDVADALFDKHRSMASIHSLTDLGECDPADGEDCGTPKGKKITKDWAYRDPNQRFLPGHH